MSRLTVETRPPAVTGFDDLSQVVARRVAALSPDQCPVEFTAALTRLFLSESCGKCTPCRVGLTACAALMDRILAGECSTSDIETLASTAQMIFESADCAIGFQAGDTIINALGAFSDDFVSHVEGDICAAAINPMPPCRAACPAHIDIPGYLACVGAGRPADALRVIRNDNPLPTVCGYVSTPASCAAGARSSTTR